MTILTFIFKKFASLQNQNLRCTMPVNITGECLLRAALLAKVIKKKGSM